MKLNELVNACDAEGAVDDREIAGVACHSREVRPGWLFVAVPGHRRDGAAFIDEAVARGAVAVIGEGRIRAPAPAAALRVSDARLALARVATRFHGNPADRLTMVGVTGTNGKTTVAFMLRDLLRAAGRRPGLLSTVLYEIGERRIPPARTTPEAPLLQGLLADMCRAGCDAAVMEVSSHGLVQQRTHGIGYDVAVFTNLTREHLDYHETMEAYFAAKRRLFESLESSGKRSVAVVNVDDIWGRRLVDLLPPGRPRFTYGQQSGADVRAEHLALDAGGATFTCTTPWGRQAVSLRLRGRFNVSNALAAIAAGGALGLELQTMAYALAGLQAVPGRLEAVETMRGFKVFVDYAHTDDALENVLTTLRELARGRLIVVFGCGGDRDRSKRALMGAVASRLADISLLTSDNPRSEDPAAILAQIEAGFDKGAVRHVIVERRSAIAKALDMAREGDTVLIAGKGHETFQELRDKTVAFDDRLVAMELLRLAPALPSGAAAGSGLK